MTRFRNMTLEDCKSISEMEAEYFSMPWSLEDFEKAVDNPYYLYRVMEDMDTGEIEAYCGSTLIMDEANITQIAVRKKCRGKNIGYLLLQDFMQKAHQKGANVFYLEVRKSNASAIRLYEKSGFVTDGIRKGFYDAPKEDAILMSSMMLKNTEP